MAVDEAEGGTGNTSPAVSLPTLPVVHSPSVHAASERRTTQPSQGTAASASNLAFLAAFGRPVAAATPVYSYQQPCRAPADASTSSLSPDTGSRVSVMADHILRGHSPECVVPPRAPLDSHEAR